MDEGFASALSPYGMANIQRKIPLPRPRLHAEGALRRRRRALQHEELDRRRRRRLRHVGEGVFDRGDLPGWISASGRVGVQVRPPVLPTAAPITPFKGSSAIAGGSDSGLVSGCLFSAGFHLALPFVELGQHLVEPRFRRIGSRMCSAKCRTTGTATPSPIKP